MNKDEILREILQSEARSVEPSADGWRLIRDGIEQRQRRRVLLRLAYAGGAAAALTAVAVVVFSLGGTSGKHTIQPAPQPSTQPTVTAPQSHPLVGAIWPFHTQEEADAWQPGGATQNLATPDGAAQSFAKNVLRTLAQTKVIGNASGTATVELAHTVAGNRFVVATATLRQVGGPWVLYSLTTPSITVTTPAAGDAPTSPMDVRGTYQAVDPAFDVWVVQGDLAGSRRSGTVRATTGPEGLHASVPFDPFGEWGIVVVTNQSLVDSGISEATVVAIRGNAAGPTSAPGQPTAAPLSPLPDAFVAIVDQRVAIVDTGSGQVQTYLTDQQPGGGAYDAQLGPNGDVVYVQGAGTCASAIMSVPIRGGTPKTLMAGGAPGYVYSHPALNVLDELQGYVRTRCAPAATEDRTEVLGYSKASGTFLVLDHGRFDVSGPLTGVGDLSYVATTNSTTEIRVVSPIGEPAFLRFPADSCPWTAAAERGKTGHLLAAKNCKGHIVIVDFDMSVANPSATPVFSHDYADGITWLDTDATGQHFIWVLGSTNMLMARTVGQQPHDLGPGQYPSW